MPKESRAAGTPLLSIVVAAYNAQDFIGTALASVAAQMGPAHELIVVDDGSVDATAERVEQVRTQYPGLSLRMVHQENQGVAGARNRGLSEACGDYIAFVDSDDLLLPGALGALDDAIARHRPDVIACDFQWWYPHKERKSRHVALGYPGAELLTDRDAILQTYFADRHTYLWANVIRREMYRRLPQPVFPPGRVYEDLAVLSCLLSQCASLYRLAVPTIAYRQHAASITKSISAKSCADCAGALRQVRIAFANRPMSDALRLQIDVAACYFYIGIVKNTYQLAWGEGRAARARVKALFLDSLFHQPEHVLAAMEQGALPSRNRAQDRVAAGQVRQALRESIAFALAKTASRKIKQWQRLAT